MERAWAFKLLYAEPLYLHLSTSCVGLVEIAHLSPKARKKKLQCMHACMVRCGGFGLHELSAHGGGGCGRGL